jgi:serine/threonine-protein kinase
MASPLVSTRLQRVSAAQWKRLESVVDAALDAPPEIRDTIVRERCHGDQLLLAAALDWLRGCDADAGHLDAPLEPAELHVALQSRPDSTGTDEASGAAPWRAAPDGVPGRTIGHWRLLRELGRGGMGVVYLAERIDGDVAMRVALKRMRHRETLDAVGIRRFHDERRILAALNHPAIAKLVDVGVEDGAPWLAMEYIVGAPIDVWCNARRASIEERLTLCCTVADAVHHAHTRLVVHRDLKPANILVSDDGRPTLLDFGIAKLLDAGAELSEHTMPGSQPMTPAYASPEQKRGEAPSMASDVYALGVLMHLLVIGTLPRDHTLPSQLLTATARDAHSGDHRASTGTIIDAERVAGERRMTAARLQRRVRGDLDAIIRCALNPVPSARYATADALAADIRRHLTGRPVLAQRDSTWYRLRKLVTRNPAASAAVAAAAVIACAFTGSMVLQSRQLQAQARALEEQTLSLRLERDKASEVTRFLQGVLASANPYQPAAKVPTLRDVLDRGAADVEQRLGHRPEIQAQLYSAMAPAYSGLGDWTRAGELAARSVALRRAATVPDTAELAAALIYLANVRLSQRRGAEAEAHVREAMALNRTSAGANAPLSISALSTLGAALQGQRKFDEATAILASLLRDERARRPLRNERLAQLARNLGHVKRDQRRYAEAIALYAEAYANHRASLGPAHPETANSAVNLGNAYLHAGDLARALPLLRDGVRTKRRLLGIGHQDVAGDQLTYASALERAGEVGEARRLREEAAAVLAGTVGRDRR